MHAPQARIDWEDLRLVLAVREAGTLTGAARRLGVDHSSAFRRLGALEKRLGVRLFERARDGYAPTPAGEATVASARRMLEDLSELERRLAGEDLRPSGSIRVTTTDSLVDFLAPLFGAFRAAHPQIAVELAVANAFFTLTRRDADVAIRPAAEAPEALAGRRVTSLATALYAAPAYVARNADRALEEHDWIGLDESLAHLGSARWMQARISPARIVARSSSVLALRSLARGALGVAPLPCYLGDEDETLVRVQAAPIAEMESALWLLVHPDLRRVARIRAFLGFAAEWIEARRARLEGRAVSQEAKAI